MAKKRIKGVKGEGIRYVDYRELKPFQGNLKDLFSKNYKKIAKSFEEFGNMVPVFVWKCEATLYLLDGHQRHRYWMTEGIEFEYDDGSTGFDVPCWMVSAKDEKEARKKLLLITSQFGTITQDGYEEFTFYLDDEWLEESVNFDAIFTEEEEEPEELPEEGEFEEELPEKAKTVLGDLYELHSLDTGIVHRIQCGDSTDSDVVGKTLGGETPILMVTDPPYGVNYDPKWRTESDRYFGELKGKYKVKNEGEVKNDNEKEWGDAYALFPGDVIYIWHAGLHAKDIMEGIQKIGFVCKAQIIWNKPQGIISRGNYNTKHEPCWYAIRKGKNHNWQGDNTQTTVWDIAGMSPFGKSQDPNDTRLKHGTQKPLECMARPIRNNTAKKEQVYDPFLGSGTTLIACEQLERVCYGQELDEKYMDVIVKRWVKFMEDNNRRYKIIRNGKELIKDDLNHFKIKELA